MDARRDLDGPYDVVLIDEVGAATLPEVLLAVAKASTDRLPGSGWESGGQSGDM
jgi:hypothetical protein